MYIWMISDIIKNEFQVNRLFCWTQHYRTVCYNTNTSTREKSQVWSNWRVNVAFMLYQYRTWSHNLYSEFIRCKVRTTVERPTNYKEQALKMTQRTSGLYCCVGVINFHETNTLIFYINQLISWAFHILISFRTAVLEWSCSCWPVIAQ